MSNLTNVPHYNHNDPTFDPHLQLRQLGTRKRKEGGCGEQEESKRVHSNRNSKSIKTQFQQRNKEIQVQAKNRTETK